MNAVDWTVAAVICVAAAFGARKGLVRQVAALVAIVGGLAIANRLAPALGAALRSWLPPPPFDRYVAYLLIFAAFFAGAALAGRRLGARVRQSPPLARFDRAGGAALGATKGIVVVYFCFFVLLCFPTQPLAAALRDSLAAPLMLRAVGRTALLFPPEFQSRGEECVREAQLARAKKAAPAVEPEACTTKQPVN